MSTYGARGTGRVRCLVGLGLLVVAWAFPCLAAAPERKPPGERCHTSRSCRGAAPGKYGVCVKPSGRKFGTCCIPTGAEVCDGEDNDCNGLVDDGPGRRCDDDNACTTGDTCQDGSCVGTPIDCDDDDRCTGDSCDGGTCVHTPQCADAIPPSTVTVDPTVRIEVTEVAGLDGGPPRPVTALTDRSGIPMHFVENELVVVTDDAGAAAALAARWGGTLVKSFVPADAGIPGAAAQHLVRVAPSGADLPQLIADLRDLEPTARNDLRVASETGLRLLAAAARESAAGGIVSLNAVGTGAGFEQSTTTEHGDLPICTSPPPVPPVVDGCVPSGIAGSEPFWSDAYLWSYMMTGGVQNIGVGEAWRALSLAGLLGNKVKIAVIDGGFAANATDNPIETEYDDNDIFAQDGPIPNEGRCSGGAPCPYHGANVVSAAMGPADDRQGAAGPGGPVAEALEVRTAGDNFGAVTAFGVAFSRGARIINMSFGGRYPATLSWQAEPFNLVTALAATAGTLIVASSGNEGADIDSEDCVPITGSPCWEDAWWWPCENDGVFCVGALNDNATTRASISNYGAEDVDLYAPGAVWVGSDPQDVEPKLFNGTSASAPFVSGVASLVMAANPQLRGLQVADHLLQTAWQPGDPGVPRYVNARGAVNLALGGSPVCTPPEILTSTPDHYTAPCLENVFEVTHSQAFGPFRYQWRKVVPATDGRIDLVDGGRFAGVTTARMTINPFLPEDEGRYDLVVSNLCGSTASAPIGVTLVNGRVERVSSLLEPRSHVGMAFDRGRGRMVLYGGITPSFFDNSNETWERDAAAAWQFVTNQGPGPRFDAFMEYDEARGVTVLFGGFTCTQLACPVEQFDTWEWNGTTWTERPADPVSTRSTRSTLYDPVRQRVVRIDFDFSLFEWDGTAWTRRPTSPDPVEGSPSPASTNNSVGFDRSRNVYVLKSRTDTWELDAAGGWHLKERQDWALGSPNFQERVGMVFDPNRGRMLLYSVIQPQPPADNSYEGSLWEWTGSRWVRQPASLLPTGEHRASMVWDSTRRRAVITGIYQSASPQSDVFEWRSFVDDPTCSLGPQ